MQCDDDCVIFVFTEVIRREKVLSSVWRDAWEERDAKAVKQVRIACFCVLQEEGPGVFHNNYLMIIFGGVMAFDS